MSDKKLTYEQIEFLYQAAIHSANKVLFEEKFEEHGWTQKEFIEMFLWTSKAIEEGKLQRWMN